MLRCVTDARAVEEEVVVAARDDLERTAPMELSHRICSPDEAVVYLGGDLDLLSAEVAVNYVKDVIDRHRGPVTVNLTALAFCDARGLAALVRMAGYAERTGCPFRLASPSPRLVKMRITRLDHKFFATQTSVLGRPDLAISGARDLPADQARRVHAGPRGQQEAEGLHAFTGLPPGPPRQHAGRHRES